MALEVQRGDEAAVVRAHHAGEGDPISRFQTLAPRRPRNLATRRDEIHGINLRLEQTGLCMDSCQPLLLISAIAEAGLFQNEAIVQQRFILLRRDQSVKSRLRILVILFVSGRHRKHEPL